MKHPSTDPKLNPLRRAAFYGLTLLLIYGFLEVASWIAYAFVEDDPFSFVTLQTRRTRVINTPGESIRADSAADNRPRHLNAEAVHPYIGFVQDPATQRQTNDFGFSGPPLPLGASGESADTVYVVVLGGSVAMLLVYDTIEILRQELQRVELFADKEVFIANLALGGMKQPQQLMTVNYFLSLDARIDLIINLDGFNEVVLPSVDNVKLGTFPFYPRRWKVRVAGLADQDLLRQAGRIAYLESLRYQVARFFSRSPMRFSVTANVFWDRLDLGLLQSIENKRVALTLELTGREDKDQQASTYGATGPTRRYASDDARYRDFSAYWKRSSITLNNLAQGSGIHYFHFLQPNQYVPGSKTFSEQERSVAMPDGHHHKEPARQGYAHLMAAGKDLVSAGINFTDLTMMFAGNDEVLYVDGCCHFNRRGYELITREMARVIREQLDGG